MTRLRCLGSVWRASPHQMQGTPDRAFVVGSDGLGEGEGRYLVEAVRVDAIEDVVHAFQLTRDAKLLAVDRGARRIAYALDTCLMLMDSEGGSRHVDDAVFGDEPRAAFFGERQVLAWVDDRHRLCAEGMTPVPLADEQPGFVRGHPTRDLLTVETFVPQDSSSAYLFSLQGGQLVAEKLSTSQNSAGLEILGFTADDHLLLLDDADIHLVRVPGRRFVRTWKTQSANIRASSASGIVLVRHDEEEAVVHLRRDDLLGEIVRLEPPCGEDGAPLNWAELHAGPVLHAFYGEYSARVFEVRAYDLEPVARRLRQGEAM